MKGKYKSGWRKGDSFKINLRSLRSFSLKHFDEWAATGSQVLVLLDEIRSLKAKNNKQLKEINRNVNSKS